MGVDMRSLFIATILAFSTQSFAQTTLLSPIELKKMNGDFYSLSKKEPKPVNLLGSWDCVGSAGYSKVGKCKINQLRFSRTYPAPVTVAAEKGKSSKTVQPEPFYSITLVGNKNTQYSAEKIDFGMWPTLNSGFADSKIYNNIFSKKASKDTLGQIILLGSSTATNEFVLSDCTSLGDRLLICKTKGDYQDYKCEFPEGHEERCSQLYESNMKLNDEWSIFVRQGAVIEGIEKIGVKAAEFQNSKKKKS